MLRDTHAGNSFSVSLKKVWAINETAQNFFQCKPCLFAEVSNCSHAGKAVAKFKAPNYNYNLSKFSAIYPLAPSEVRARAISKLKGDIKKFELSGFVAL
jgi:hypothetical protein